MATEFHLLGTVDALVDGQSVDLGHNKQRGVLAVLLMHANGPVPVDRLLDHVWGEHPPRRGRDALYSYMSRLRTVLATVPGASWMRRAAASVRSRTSAEGVVRGSDASDALSVRIASTLAEQAPQAARCASIWAPPAPASANTLPIRSA